MRKLKNIRTRLAVWYALILGGILTACAMAVVAVFSHGLREEFDRTLTEHFERANRHLERDAAGKIRLRRAERTGRDPAIRDFGEEIPVEVLSQDGNVLYRSAAWDRAKIDEFAVSNPLTADRKARSFRADGGERFRMMQGISHFEESQFWLRTALSEERVWKEVKELILVFLILLPLAMIATGGAGYWMASKALKPIQDISRQTEMISAEKLKERLQVANPDDELGLLTRVINSLLSRLEKSFEELKRFTSDASHELRTPLQALKSLGEVALQKNQEANYYREVISNMLEETDRMTGLTQSLLTLSRADAGNYKLQKSPTQLHNLLEEVRSLLEILAEEKGQKIVLKANSQILANVDQIIFRQAIMNLVDNAIRYSPNNSEISISLSHRNNGDVLIEVSDQGPGIPAEHQSRIFDRFYRIEKSRSRELGGSGLGLSIAKWAVEAHDGRIELESIPERGSIFRIVFPTT